VETESVSPGALRRGEIIIFETPKAAAGAACNTSGKFIKRVIGLPGETVSERRGIVYVGGSRLAEPYLQPARRDHNSGTWKVPRGHYFLMGDNRRESCDSRVFGPVPFSTVIGRVTAIIRDGNTISMR